MESRVIIYKFMPIDKGLSACVKPIDILSISTNSGLGTEGGMHGKVPQLTYIGLMGHTLDARVDMDI